MPAAAALALFAASPRRMAMMEVCAKSETTFDEVAVCVGVDVVVDVVVDDVDGVCVPVAVPVVDDDGVTDGDDVPVIPVNGECCVVVVG